MPWKDHLEDSLTLSRPLILPLNTNFPKEKRENTQTRKNSAAKKKKKGKQGKHFHKLRVIGEQLMR